jgi:hypothetical protein
MSTRRKSLAVIGLAAVAILMLGATVASAAPVIETFNSYLGGTALTAIPVPPGGSGPWTAGSGYTVVAGGGVAGSNGLSIANPIFNWKAQSFTWSTLPVGIRMMMAMDFQTSSIGKFDDDRVGWTNAPDSTGSSTNQLALQLDNRDESGMVVYWNSTRTNLNPLAGIAASTWYRFEVEYTKLTNTSAKIVGTLTALDTSGIKTGTPYVGTVADTSAFSNPPATDRFTSAFQCPSYKNYSQTAGNADNVTFDANVPEPATLSLLAIGGLLALRRRHR